MWMLEVELISTNTCDKLSLLPLFVYLNISMGTFVYCLKLLFLVIPKYLFIFLLYFPECTSGAISTNITIVDTYGPSAKPCLLF